MGLGGRKKDAPGILFPGGVSSQGFSAPASYPGYLTFPGRGGPWSAGTGEM